MSGHASNTGFYPSSIPTVLEVLVDEIDSVNCQSLNIKSQPFLTFPTRYTLLSLCVSVMQDVKSECENLEGITTPK